MNLQSQIRNLITEYAEANGIDETLDFLADMYAGLAPGAGGEAKIAWQIACDVSEAVKNTKRKAHLEDFG